MVYKYYKYYKGFYILYLVDLFKKKNTFRVPATFSPLLSTGNTTVNETDILFLYFTFGQMEEGKSLKQMKENRPGIRQWSMRITRSSVLSELS